MSLSATQPLLAIGPWPVALAPGQEERSVETQEQGMDMSTALVENPGSLKVPVTRSADPLSGMSDLQYVFLTGFTPRCAEHSPHAPCDHRIAPARRALHTPHAPCDHRSSCASRLAGPGPVA